MVAPSRPVPLAVTVRTYAVGFGDCFVVIVHYSDQTERHILIDFGSTRLPRTPVRRPLAEIAQNIVDNADGRLAMVVATHRHADHISGFAGDAGEIIAGARPQMIVQPWTEAPDIATDAVEPTVSDDELRMVNAMGSMDKVASFIKYITDPLTDDDGEVIKDDTGKTKVRRPWAVEGLNANAARQLNFLGETNIKNEAAVRNLQQMAEASQFGRGFYVKSGDDSLNHESFLPGVTFEVLGPPTVKQWDMIRSQRTDDQEEFWAVQEAYWQAASGTDRRSPQRIFNRTKIPKEEWPFPARWAIPKLQKLRGDQLYQVVRTLDRALNNTSIILLIHVGKRTLLFPGDAQIESWMWPLFGAENSAEWRRKLADVDLYKVGHHGSKNATPKTLFRLWEEAGRVGADLDQPMKAVMSTIGGVHGHRHRESEVPRRTLKRALKTMTDFHTTQDQRGRDALVHDIYMDAQVD